MFEFIREINNIEQTYIISRFAVEKKANYKYALEYLLLAITSNIKDEDFKTFINKFVSSLDRFYDSNSNINIKRDVFLQYLPVFNNEQTDFIEIKNIIENNQKDIDVGFFTSKKVKCTDYGHTFCLLLLYWLNKHINHSFYNELLNFVVSL